MTLVCLSLDRYLAIAKPMASLKRTEKIGIKLRGQIMIATAWMISVLWSESSQNSQHFEIYSTGTCRIVWNFRQRKTTLFEVLHNSGTEPFVRFAGL